MQRYPAMSVIRMAKASRMRWAGNVARVGNKKPDVNRSTWALIG